jgi:hypothetical protein
MSILLKTVELVQKALFRNVQLLLRSATATVPTLYQGIHENMALAEERGVIAAQVPQTSECRNLAKVVFCCPSLLCMFHARTA